MINWALMGKFGKIDRDGLSSEDLDLLAKLENLDTVLIGCGASYEDRKKELEQFVGEQRSGLPTCGLQTAVVPWPEVLACYALDKQALEPETSPDATYGLLTNG